MADKTKVQEWFEVADITAQYETLAVQIASQVSTKLALKGDSDGARAARIQTRIYATFRDRVMDTIAEIYGHLLTNDEVDQLIQLA